MAAHKIIMTRIDVLFTPKNDTIMKKLFDML